LATLYAVGFVGAIATNLGATSTDFTLDIKWGFRVLMWLSFIIMVAIEITLFIDKPDARLYVLFVVVFGLILRGLSRERKERLQREGYVSAIEEVLPKKEVLVKESILCAVQRISKGLTFAIEKSNQLGEPLHILFIREQSVISDLDLSKTWESDSLAKEVMDFANAKGKKELLSFYYCVTDSTLDIIAAYAMRLETSEVIIDAAHPTRQMVQWLRGFSLKKLRPLLPDKTHLSIVK
jgi:hypothetical protein